MADSRDYHLATGTSGEEFWLVPRKNKAPGGHRMIEIRNSKKHVPVSLQGMWTSGDSAQRAVDDYLKGVTAKKTQSRNVKKESEES